LPTRPIRLISAYAPHIRRPPHTASTCRHPDLLGQSGSFTTQRAGLAPLAGRG
jgi:hypothetical protein